MRAVSVVLIAIASPAHADTPTPDPCACSPNKPGFHRADALTGGWGGMRSDLFDAGIKIQGTYAGEAFASPDHGGVVAGLGSLAVDVELATLVGGSLGTVHVSGFAIHGDGLSKQLMDVYGVSNNVADPDVRLFEAWLDQPLGPLSLRAGLLSADQQLVIAQHATALINATFGIVGIFSYDILGPVYPVAAPGAAATLETGPVTTRVAVYDGDRINTHGIPTELGDDALVVGEVEVAGTLKLGAYHHTELGTGYYAILDRQLERYLGAFTRVGISPDEPLDFYMDAGIRIGPGPLRPRDFAAAGIALARSDIGTQTIVELTYQYLVTGWLTIQPDVQILLDHAGTTGIVATRAVVAL